MARGFRTSGSSSRERAGVLIPDRGDRLRRHLGRAHAAVRRLRLRAIDPRRNGRRQTPLLGERAGDMSARIEVSSESGVVALAGPAAAAFPAGLDQESLLRQLEPLAHSAELFFLVTDDPVRYRIDVIGNEPLPPGLERDFEALGGAFRLEAPSRRVVLIGWDKAGEPREAGGVS